MFRRRNHSFCSRPVRQDHEFFVLLTEFKKLHFFTSAALQHPQRSVYTIIRTCFMDRSIASGIVNPEKFRFAGDGIPVVTAAWFRSHYACDCWKRGIHNCSCNRFFSHCRVCWPSCSGVPMGKTVIVITHDPELVQEVADCVIAFS